MILLLLARVQKHQVPIAPLDSEPEKIPVLRDVPFHSMPYHTAPVWTFLLLFSPPPRLARESRVRSMPTSPPNSPALLGVSLPPVVLACSLLAALSVGCLRFALTRGSRSIGYQQSTTTRGNEQPVVRTWSSPFLFLLFLIPLPTWGFVPVNNVTVASAN